MEAEAGFLQVCTFSEDKVELGLPSQECGRLQQWQLV